MDNVPTEHYKEGEIIIAEGDPSNAVFLIVGGSVKIVKQKGRSQHLLATQGKDTIFGEMALIDGKRRSATVIAIEDTYCHKCNSSGIVKEINNMEPDLRIALQSMATLIRERNKAIISKNPLPEGVIAPTTNEKGELLMTEDEIKSPEVQELVAEISNPFLRSLFRVLMTTAFGGGR